MSASPTTTAAAADSTHAAVATDNVNAADAVHEASTDMTLLTRHDDVPLRPWHERAYADGPRPVPPRVPSSGAWTRLHRAQYNQDIANGVRVRKPRRKRQRKKRTKAAPIDWSQRNPEVVAAVKQQVATAYARCPCVQCTMLQRDHEPAVAYRCPARYCQIEFTDYLALFEHQVSTHGRILPQCRRIRMELFHQDRGVVPFPPVTVYAGQQLLRPAYRPTAWTLARVDLEAQTLHAKLFSAKRVIPGALHIWDAFTMAYHHVRQGGAAQLDAQLIAALEYYNSSLVHPIATRTFQDGADAVGPGRNWLLSPELERAERLAPFFAVPTDDVIARTTFPFKRSRGTADNSSSSNDELDGSDDDDELASTLLFESGEPVAPREQTAPATESNLVVQRLAKVLPWHRFLELDDIWTSDRLKRSAAKKSTPTTRTTTKRRAAAVDSSHTDDGDNEQTDKDADIVVAAPVKKYNSRWCRNCGDFAHIGLPCPVPLPPPDATREEVARCGNCGLRGHTRPNCFQVRFYNIVDATSTSLERGFQ